MGVSPHSELKKMSESLSVFGGSEKKFLELYKKSKRVKFDFMYLSIDYLEVWRNFDERLWTQEDLYKEPLKIEVPNKFIEKEEEENNII